MKQVFKLFPWLVVLSMIAFASGTLCASELDAFTGEKGVLRIAGGTAHIPVMKEAAKRIMEMNYEIQITIAGGGSGAGIKQVGEGLVDIGNSGRNPRMKKFQSIIFPCINGPLTVWVRWFTRQILSRRFRPTTQGYLCRKNRKLEGTWRRRPAHQHLHTGQLFGHPGGVLEKSPGQGRYFRESQFCCLQRCHEGGCDQ